MTFSWVISYKISFKIDVLYVSVAYLVPKISIKMYFPSNCNFREFVTFFTEKKKKNLSNGGKSFFPMVAEKRCDSIAISYELNHHKKLHHITSFLGRHREKWLANVLRVFFFFFFSWKKLQICENCDISGTR